MTLDTLLICVFGFLFGALLVLVLTAPEVDE
jgi:hypothetical protein